jgi:hypothetical protein
MPQQPRSSTDLINARASGFALVQINSRNPHGAGHPQRNHATAVGNGKGD